MCVTNCFYDYDYKLNQKPHSGKNWAKLELSIKDIYNSNWTKLKNPNWFRTLKSGLSLVQKILRLTNIYVSVSDFSLVHSQLNVKSLYLLTGSSFRWIFLDFFYLFITEMSCNNFTVLNVSAVTDEKLKLPNLWTHAQPNWTQSEEYENQTRTKLEFSPLAKSLEQTEPKYDILWCKLTIV